MVEFSVSHRHHSKIQGHQQQLPTQFQSYPPLPGSIVANYPKSCTRTSSASYSWIPNHNQPSLSSTDNSTLRLG